MVHWYLIANLNCLLKPLFCAVGKYKVEEDHKLFFNTVNRACELRKTRERLVTMRWVHEEVPMSFLSALDTFQIDSHWLQIVIQVVVSLVAHNADVGQWLTVSSTDICKIRQIQIAPYLPNLFCELWSVPVCLVCMKDVLSFAIQQASFSFFRFPCPSVFSYNNIKDFPVSFPGVEVWKKKREYGKYFVFPHCLVFTVF